MLVFLSTQVTSADGKQDVGKIFKQWSGLNREMFTDSDHFGISFPLDLDVKIKAVMLGACFLIVRPNACIQQQYFTNDFFNLFYLFRI